MLNSNEVEFEVLERNIPLCMNGVLVNGEELSCRLEWEKDLCLSLCHMNPGVYLEDSVLRRNDTATLGNQLRNFEGTCSTFMSVDCLRALTSSRISSPLKFLRKVENRLHSTVSYCRQTEFSAAPVATYMCI
jgi:hypothetical protein